MSENDSAGAMIGRPARGHFGGVRAQRVAFAEQVDLRRIAPGAEIARRDEPVAAVAAGSAQHRDAPLGPRQPRRRARDRQPRPLHQHEAGNADVDREAVGVGHLARGQQFGTIGEIKHGAIVAPLDARDKGWTAKPAQRKLPKKGGAPDEARVSHRPYRA